MSSKRKKKGGVTKPCAFCGKPEPVRHTPGRVWIGVGSPDELVAASPVCKNCSVVSILGKWVSSGS